MKGNRGLVKNGVLRPMGDIKTICLFFLLILAGCGGGGGSSASTPPSTSTPTNTTTVIEPLNLPNTVAYQLPDEISPETAVSQMQVGINLGNTLDAPNEGEWAIAAKLQYFIDFKEAGFKHVRIPITWHEHLGTEPPYIIDATFLDRVEELVDWALAQDYYVIINAHHESWIKIENADQGLKNRFDNIWIKVAERFKEKPAKLVFEILNEPNGMTMTEINAQNKRTLAIIRNENPNRLVVFSGNGFTPIDSLLATDIPDVQDEFLIGNFHSYDPWPFAGQCTRGWGSDEDKSNLRLIYQQASDWSQINQIPVMVNEFGAAKYDFTTPANICELDDRLAYLAYHVALGKEFGIAQTFWDDGGSFSTFDRTNHSWGPEKDILVINND